MHVSPLIAAAVGALSITAAHAGSGTVYVDAASNIYAAGSADTSAFEQGGILPLSIDIAGSTEVQFTAVGVGPAVDGSPTGGATCVFNGTPSTGDGANCVNSSTNVSAANGYGSFVLNGRTMPLVGLFLGSTVEATPTGVNSSFDAENAQTSFAPLLQQVFFIGDGLSDLGALQTFAVPTGATKLYLGFADAFGFSGAPGYFSDNHGGLSVSYVTTPVPEPASVALGLAGLLLVLGPLRARKPAQVPQA